MTSTAYAATTSARAGVVARDLTRGLSIPLVLFMAIIAAGFLVAGLIAAATTGIDGPTRSGWENSAYATRYFPLALGTMLTPTYLPVAVAHGVTRRVFGLGTALVVLGLAGVMAALEAAGYLIEDGLYRLAGGTPTFTTPHLFDSGTQVWIVIPEVWIVVAGNVAAGWLIGTAYYRWSWFWPTITLPLLLVPALAVEALMSVGWAGSLMIDVIGIDRLPAGIAVAASLAILAVTLWGIAQLNRTIPIRPRKA